MSSYNYHHTSILNIHPDIIQTNILTRLDGSSLVSTGSASSELNNFCMDDKLWINICNSTWPSTDDRRLIDIIATFPAGHRSFFSDCYPSLDWRCNPKANHVAQETDSLTISELISAVDIHYDNQLIFSKVHVTETSSDWFMSSPLRVDLLDPKETIPTPVKMLEGNNDLFCSQLDQNLTLSWILVDPITRRAANLSSMRPVSVERSWLNDDIRAHYVTTLPAGYYISYESGEFVQCSMVVVCGGTEGGDLQVKEVSFQMHDMDGKSLSGRESLLILHGALVGQRIKKGKREDERERYEMFMEKRRERGERKQRKERRMDMVCMLTGVTIFLAFCGLIWLR